MRDIGDHLARLRLADLFLDTLPYNAHATASDALWAGLPVLTCLGNSFPAGVAAGALHAVGLRELVTKSLAEYEEQALALARNPERLAAIKAKLVRNRDTAPLFDTARFTARSGICVLNDVGTDPARRAPGEFLHRKLVRFRSDYVTGPIKVFVVSARTVVSTRSLVAIIAMMLTLSGISWTPYQD